MTIGSMRRRECITLLGGAAAASSFAWPLPARAQQPAMPVIGVLSVGSGPSRHPAFLQALRESGYVEGRTVEFDFRWGPYDQLPALAAELVRRRVAVIRTGGPPLVRAAMAATATIPIVFAIGEDPVKEGLVASLNRPGGNVTGFANFSNELVAKRLDLLHELVPTATVLGFLANQTNPNIKPDTADVQAVADSLGLRLRVFTASTERELQSAFDDMVRERLGALLVGVDPWFREQRERIAALAARHAVPASYERRDFAEAGGLMSYGTDDNERERQMGIYIARILKGAKPADLPVQQATKFEFILNLKAARALGLDVPTSILLRANEVIE
jgi:putative tryptophan/tyrosine transport system substrate-binding protein